MAMHLLFIAAAAAQPAGGGGIEQIVREFGIDWPSLIAQIVTFAVVALVLYKLAFKPVLATIDTRQQKIEEGLRYTEEMKARLAATEQQTAEALKKASLEGQRIIDEARKSAKEFLDRQTQEATERSSQLVTKAQQAIDLERQKMMSEVRAEIARLVVLAASRVLSRELSDQEKARYAESAAQELANV